MDPCPKDNTRNLIGGNDVLRHAQVAKSYHVRVPLARHATLENIHASPGKSTGVVKGLERRPANRIARTRDRAPNQPTRKARLYSNRALMLLVLAN